MSDIIAKLRAFVAGGDGGYLLSKPEAQWLISNAVIAAGAVERAEFNRSKDEIKSLKGEIKHLKEEIQRLKGLENIPWGQEVPVITFDQIRAWARRDKARREGLKGANG